MKKGQLPGGDGAGSVPSGEFGLWEGEAEGLSLERREWGSTGGDGAPGEITGRGT